MSTYYSVFVTPKNSDGSYGTGIDISDYVKFDGIGRIRKSIDATDFDVGIFTYDDLQLTAKNLNGYLNEETDIRSIFKYGRDKAKVDVYFTNTAGDVITFRGLLNEEATRMNTETEEIKFKILSRDSVLRNINVPSGTVSDGMTCKAAMYAILNQIEIARVLGVTLGNINPYYNFTIDVGSKFDDKTVRDAINNLLLASNSVYVLDSSDNIIVKSRSEDSVTDVLNLYGPFDIYRRQNTSRLLDYNTGYHRNFTAFKINGYVAENSAYSQTFGYRQKESNFDFITDSATVTNVAKTLLAEFQIPKLECQVEVPCSTAPNVDLLNRVALNWPLLLKPVLNKFFPVIGITKIGDTDAPLPYRYGSVEIKDIVAWKVIEIVEDPVKFVKTLKLRQIGKTLDDGYFILPGNAVIGYAVVGQAKIAGTGTISYNPSVIGAAVIGNTQLA